MSAIRVQRRETCRACGSEDLVPLLSLEPTPPANAFQKEFGVAEERYPLDLHGCRQCEHVQLLDVLDPSALFSDYVYQSGTSESFRRHFQDYAREVVKRLGLGAESFALEVGSNDGVMLKALVDCGVGRVLGVDPARTVAAIAQANGIPTVVEFFDQECAAKVARRHGRADVVIANNVFAHADDLFGILVGVDRLLRVGGTFVFEVQYLVDLYQKGLFDLLYHEHVSYWHLRPLEALLADAGMVLVGVDRVDTHGGSIRCWAQRTDEAMEGALEGPSPERQERLESLRLIAEGERPLRLAEPETWTALEVRIASATEKLKAALRARVARGLHVVGYGAPAKSTTLLHQMRLGRAELAYIVDDSPLKQGLYTPGTQIQVLPPSALYEDATRPDVVLILAWNFAGPILEKHRELLRRGVEFLIPLPEIEVCRQP